MSAICKTIPIHSRSVNPLMEYVKNNDKTKIERDAEANANGKADLTADLDIEQAMGYAANPLKTIAGFDDGHKEVLVSGVKCDPDTAALEFKQAQEDYKAYTGKSEKTEPFEYTDRRTGETKTVKREPVTAIHLIQSFEETDLDPQLVHQMGIELAERLGVQAVVCTHMNKEHLHNHIVINTYQPEGHKWNCNLDMIMQIREMSDEIQREYGIPINFEEPRKQLYNSRGHEKSYYEWQQEQEGLSWKEQMRQDIYTVSSIAKTRADYLSMMEAYGYKVEKATENSITFRCLENGKKIRDKTLGEGFSVGELYPLQKKEEREPIQRTYPKAISVARYDWDGRRRTDLEMAIRKAIAMIQKIGNLFLRKGRNKGRTSSYKIQMLQDALNGIKKYDLEKPEDLNERINTVGAELSHAKSTVYKVEQEKPLYDEIQDAIDTIESCRQVNTHVGDLHLHDYTQDEIRRKRAALAPPSPTMKSRLAVALHKNTDYKLLCKYDELTASECAAITDFLNGRSTEQPPMVVTAREYEVRNTDVMMERIYTRRDTSSKERFGDKTPSDASLQAIQRLLNDKGFTGVDVGKLTQYDIMSINNCLGSNPFAGPLITDEQRDLLDTALQARGLTLNRETKYVTQDECKYILRYLSGKTTKQPPLFQPFTPPYENDVENLRRFMAAKGIDSAVPIEALSKNDFNKLYSYVISYGRTPACLQNTEHIDNSVRDNNFSVRASQYKIERTLYLTQLRNAINTLRSLGYDVDVNSDLSAIKQDLTRWTAEYENAGSVRDSLAATYHDLIKIRQTLTYTRDPSFIYGDLYDPKLDESIKVEEREEKAERDADIQEEKDEREAAVQEERDERIAEQREDEAEARDADDDEEEKKKKPLDVDIDI